MFLIEFFSHTGRRRLCMKLLLHLRAHSRCWYMATRDASLWKENPAQVPQACELHILHQPLYSSRQVTGKEWGGKGWNREARTCLLLNKQMGGQWKLETRKPCDQIPTSPPSPISLPSQHITGCHLVNGLTVRPHRGPLCTSERCRWWRMEQEHQGWWRWHPRPVS